jgi:hypothetical protein
VQAGARRSERVQHTRAQGELWRVGGCWDTVRGGEEVSKGLVGHCGVDFWRICSAVSRP